MRQPQSHLGWKRPQRYSSPTFDWPSCQLAHGTRYHVQSFSVNTNVFVHICPFNLSLWFYSLNGKPDSVVLCGFMWFWVGFVVLLWAYLFVCYFVLFFPIEYLCIGSSLVTYQTRVKKITCLPIPHIFQAIFQIWLHSIYKMCSIPWTFLCHNTITLIINDLTKSIEITKAYYSSVLILMCCS